MTIGRGPEPPRAAPADGLRCPFCEASETQLISLFGSQLLTSQYRCRACGSYFEGVRKEAAHGD
jgi:transposase-like protein